ncbi:MAG TPA: capsule biosynthesis protein CapA, partial [Citreicella sp.]|nr:capsule biosynthesis protein CapA [Citreicella sp.]
WVTYERGGANGHSRLMQMTVPEMRAALERSDMEAPLPPGHWGDMRQHIFYGALYHWFVLFRNGDYRAFRPHRDLSVAREFQLYVKRLLLMPVNRAERLIETLRIRL